MTAFVDLTPELQRAMRLFQSGEFREAANLYRAMLRTSPNHPDLLHYLGMAEFKLGNRDQARELMQRSIALDGRKANVHVNLGRILLNEGDGAGALTHLRDALERDPQSAEARHMYGRALLAEGEAGGAAEQFEQVLVSRPQDAALRIDLGHAYGAGHRHPKAVETFRAVLAEQPDHTGALAGMGASLRAMNRSTEALEGQLRVTQLEPAEPGGWTSLGALYEELGRFADAEQAFRHALLLRPNYPVAVAHLLALKGVGDPDLVARGERHLAAREIVRPVRVQLHFALGRHYDAAGDFDRAFAHYRDANGIVAEGRRYKPLGVESHVGRHIEVFDRELFARKRPFGNESDRPVFIVGMPRSGTTLTEQILSSHHEVAGAGELGYFNHMSYELGARDDRGEDLSSFARDLGAADLAACAAGFLAQLDAVSTSARRVTDKMPTNFLHLGLIALTFPNARVIHCQRDPRDNLLSCFFENFQEDQRYTTRLESLAHYYGQYRRLMRHWHEVLPLPILDVQYEELVADLPAQTRRIVEFCGLDWDENCLAFHRTERAVNTPSKWQVRQPIYSSSVGRWKKYQGHIGPLLAALNQGNS